MVIPKVSDTGVWYGSMRAIFASLLFLLAASLSGHPHLWIDGDIDLVLGNDGVQTVHVRWLFDEWNSADMIFTFDQNLDGRLSRAEIDIVRAQAFTHLRQSDYFTIAFAGPERIDIPDAEAFHAAIEDGRLVYEFELPFDLRWGSLDNVIIALFDPSYFIDFISVPVQPSYRRRGQTVALQTESLYLQTQGWGTVEVPGVRMDLQ